MPNTNDTVPDLLDLDDATAALPDLDEATAALPDLDADAAALADLNGRSVADWLAHAACAGAEEALFFPDRGTLPTGAIERYCAGCPVRLDCLAEGVRAARLPGVRGGRSWSQRKALARQFGRADDQV